MVVQIKGKFTDPTNGNIYRGEFDTRWIYFMMKGILNYNHGEYVGEFKDGRYHGKGIKYPKMMVHLQENGK